MTGALDSFANSVMVHLVVLQTFTISGGSWIGSKFAAIMAKITSPHFRIFIVEGTKSTHVEDMRSIQAALLDLTLPIGRNHATLRFLVNGYLDSQKPKLWAKILRGLKVGLSLLDEHGRLEIIWHSGGYEYPPLSLDYVITMTQ